MPGAPDAKIIIDEGAAAVAKGKSPVPARLKAISRCAPNISPERLRGFAGLEWVYQRKIRLAEDELLEGQDKILADMLEDDD